MKAKTIRTEKGNSIIAFPSKYVVIDIETTGFSPTYDSIIELGAIKIENGEIIDTFHSLIKPNTQVNSFISSLTGISNKMLESAPTIHEPLRQFIEFVSDEIVVGHNVHFDANFIYDNTLREFDVFFKNDLIDTMRISKKLLPELEHHQLYELINYFKIKYQEIHRAKSDCFYTYKVFEELKKVALEKYGTIDAFVSTFKKKKKSKHKYFDLSLIQKETDSVDISNPFYNKYCVFTGKLEKLIRKEAAQIVVNLGGYCENTVTKKTNYLVLGDYDYCKSIKDGKSEKYKKAEAYMLKGQDIVILPETEFYEMIFDNVNSED